jgi:hypothetical protein
MTNWVEPDYDRLFRDHPPTEPAAPRDDDPRRIARDLGRSTGAVSARRRARGRRRERAGMGGHERGSRIEGREL